MYLKVGAMNDAYIAKMEISEEIVGSLGGIDEASTAIVHAVGKKLNYGIKALEVTEDESKFSDLDDICLYEVFEAKDGDELVVKINDVI